MRIRKQPAGTGNHYDGVNPATSVTVHETDNPDEGADAAATADYQENGAGGRTASWHWQVDDAEAVQSFEHTTRCWHAGDGDTPGGGNMTSVAVEICVNADGDYRQALANAAELVREHIVPDIGADVLVQHNHWSGKNCPRGIRAGRVQTWQQFVAACHGRDEQQENTMAGMVSPVEGEVTSGYGPRDYEPSPFHAGEDIAAPIGTDVHAVFDGVVIGEGDDLAPYRSGTRNVLIENPDGEGQLYVHLHDNTVHVGEHVEQGQVIGHVGARGNVTGPHLHLEIWADADDPASHRDPMIDFNYFGVVPGSTPVITDAPPAPPVSGGTIAGAGSSSAGGNSDGPMSDLSGADVRNIQEALDATGDYDGRIDGKPGPMTITAVETYQARQNRCGNAGLVTDGDWGTVTQAWFEWVEQLQRVLPAWRDVGNLRVDGDYGEVTAGAVSTLQSNNGLTVDGIAGPETVNYMQRYGSDIGHRPPNRP